MGLEGNTTSNHHKHCLEFLLLHVQFCRHLLLHAFGFTFTFSELVFSIAISTCSDGGDDGVDDVDDHDDADYDSDYDHGLW